MPVDRRDPGGKPRHKKIPVHMPTAAPAKKVPLPPLLEPPAPAKPKVKPKPLAPILKTKPTPPPPRTSVSGATVADIPRHTTPTPRTTTPRTTTPPPRTTTPRRTKTPSTTGDPKVAAIQRKLRKAGIKVTVDGVYGPETDAAIRRYNRQVAAGNRRSRHRAANVIKTQIIAPTGGPQQIPVRARPSERGAPPDVQDRRDLPIVATSVGSASTVGMPSDYGSQADIPGLGQHRKFRPVTDMRGDTDKLLGNILGTVISDPLGLGFLTGRVFNLARHPSLKAAGSAAAAAVGVVPFFRGGSAAAGFYRAAREGMTVGDAAREAAAVYRASTPIRTAVRTAKQAAIDRDVSAALKASATRTEIHDAIDAQVGPGFTRSEARRQKADLDRFAAQNADRIARTRTGGTLATRRAVHASDYYDKLATEFRRPTVPHNLGPAHVADDAFAAAEVQAQRRSRARFLPKSIKTAGQLKGLVSELDFRLREGFNIGKNWYVDSGRAILQYSGGDIRVGGLADRLAALTAVYSPQRAVVPNIGLALQALKEFEDTGHVTIGSVHQIGWAEKILNNQDWRAGMHDDQAMKIRSFYGNILKHIDEGLMRARGYTGREVTNDGWIGAAFGYGFNTNTLSISPHQYRFMTRVIQRLADHYGIEPEAAQAAIWMSIKAERDVSTHAMYRENPTEAILRSGDSFQTGLQKAEHNVRYAIEAASPEKEWQNLLNAAQMNQYTHEVAAGVLNAFHEAGIPARITDEGVGFYLNKAGELEMNPGVAVETPVGNRPVSEPLTAEQKKAGKKPVVTKEVSQQVTQEQRALYDGLAATLGLPLKQEAQGWIRPLVAKADIDHTAFRVILNRQLSPAEGMALHQALDETRFYVSQTVDGFLIVSNEPDILLGLAGKERATVAAGSWSHAADAVDAALGEGAARTLRDSGNMQGFTHRGGYLGRADYVGAIDSSGRPVLLHGIADRVADHVDAVDTRWRAVAAGEHRTPGLDVPHPADDLAPELFHGSPAGELGTVDPLYHTQMWREGSGFYATTDRAKAAKYAAGKTAKGERKTGGGSLHVVKLRPGAKVLDVDRQPRSFWEGLARKITGDDTDYARWAKDIAQEDAKGASHGVVERQRLIHYLTGYHDMPMTDAYYAVEDAIVQDGWQATRHTERGVPVYVVKDGDAIESVTRDAPEGAVSTPGLDIPHPADAAAAVTLPGLDVPLVPLVPPPEDLNFDVGSIVADAKDTADAVAWQHGLLDDMGNIDPGRFERPNKGLDARYTARQHTVGPGGLTAQFLKPRSRASYAGVRVIDAASKALDRSSLVEKFPGVRNVQLTQRVVKYAGRAQRKQAERVYAKVATAVEKLGETKEGSAEDAAHFWYAQLPQSHRNAEGLTLVRDMQQERLRYIVSGEAIQDLEQRELAVKAALREAATGGEAYELMNELEAIKVYRKDLPFQPDDITASVGQLNKLIADPPEVDETMISAVRRLSADRKRILIDSKRLEPDRASAREGLLARELGLEPDGTEVYIGHRLPTADTQGFATANGGLGRVKSPKGAGSRNNLVLAKVGRLRATTRVAWEDWQLAQVFDQANRSRDDLAKIAEPWPGGNLPSEDYYLLNPKGQTYPQHWRTDELSQFTDDAADREEIRRLANDVLEGFLADSHLHKQNMVEELRREAADKKEPFPDLMMVRKDLVDRYYAQFRRKGQVGKGLKAWDYAVDAVSTSIIFARVGYIPKNMVQNLIMAVPHQGIYLMPNAARAGQVLNDPDLRALIKGEVSSSGATSSLGQQIGVKKVQHAVTHFVTSMADDPARISAFLHEAAAEKIISRTNILLTSKDRDNLIRLLSDRRYERKLNDITQRAIEAMGDFARMTPDQARYARRLLIIPGWLVAGSRYPFHFALTHPARSALIMYAALGEPGAPEELQFNQPITRYLHGDKYLIGFDTRWGRERVSSLSPVSTPEELALDVYGTVRGKKSPFDYSTPTAFDIANPLIAAGVRITKGEAGDLTTSAGAEKAFAPLVPNYALIRDLIRREPSPRYPDDDTWWKRLERELGILPIHVNDVLPSHSSGGGGGGLAPGFGTGGSGSNLAPGFGSGGGSSNLAPGFGG